MGFLIKGGTIVLDGDSYCADVYVKNDKICAIGNDLDENADQNLTVIDARGCFVLPGGVDVHVHLDYPLKGTRTADGFFAGTSAAAAGGTTTIIAMIPPPEDDRTLRQTLEMWKDKARNEAVVDYSFHLIVKQADTETLREIPSLHREGFTSFKVFLGTSNAVPDHMLLQLMQVVKDCGGQLLVSAGNIAIENFAEGYLRSQGKLTVRHYPRSRPETAEVEGTARAIRMGGLIGLPLYFVHVSCAQALEEIRVGRQKGIQIIAETCPQYLMLSSKCYTEEDAGKYVLNPPLREADNQSYLWKAIKEGDIQVIASDHCSFNFRGQKDCSDNDFTLIPNGLPGLETRLLLIYNEGIGKGRINLNKFVELVSTGPAKAFGLYPRKGIIAVGSDADIVLWDPSVKRTIDTDNLTQSVDYTPYEGFKVIGSPKLTMIRGEVVFSENNFMGRKGYGRLIPRNQ
ncbi:MAG: dihydropyrimidinase [Firmicutes bacterium]|nr:dihydropyrimidinase [Bacillota bacterium]